MSGCWSIPPPSRCTKPRRAKKSTARSECLERSRGGFGTKFHAVVDALGNCLHLALTPAESADSPQLPALLAALAQLPGAVGCDKAYDTNNVLKSIADQHAVPIIPPKSTRLDQYHYDRNLYVDRNKIERFFGRVKETQGFATRYEKTAVSFLATAHLLAALDKMR